MKVRHIGCVVFNVEKSLSTFEKLGYKQISEVVFLFTKNASIIELVETHPTISRQERKE